MTRNFKNEGQNDRRPSPRHASSGQFRGDSPSRPPRARLSRDAVDRAWENGANRQYADYHPRQNTSRPPFQRSSEFERPQQSRGYENRRQGGYGAPSSDTYRPRGEGYRPRSESGPRRFPEGGQRAPGSQPGLRGEHWNRDGAPQRPGYRDHFNEQRPPRYGQEGHRTPARPGYRSESSPRSYERPYNARPYERDQQERGNFSRGPRPYERSNQERGSFSRGPRPYERDQQEHGNFSRGPRPYGGNDRARGNFSRDKRAGGPRRDNTNPRWQSRPSAQRDYAESQREQQGFRRDYAERPNTRPAFGQERPYTYDRPDRAQFEGDYEGLGEFEQAERAEEKHVTRLPDGRVLKGSRPAQRRQASFWTDVEEETNSLLPKSIPPTPQSDVDASEADEQDPMDLPIAPKRPASKARKPSAATGTRKPKTVRIKRATSTGPRADGEKVAKRKKGHAPEGPVTRPSRKGYKWPTTEG